MSDEGGLTYTDNLVLLQDLHHSGGVDLRELDRGGHGDASLLLLLDHDVGRRAVQPDAEPVKLALDNELVGERLGDVEDNEKAAAGARNGDDLTTTTLAVLGTLNDTRQVKHLKLRALVLHNTRHARQRGELVRRNLCWCGERGEKHSTARIPQRTCWSACSAASTFRRKGSQCIQCARHLEKRGSVSAAWRRAA